MERYVVWMQSMDVCYGCVLWMRAMDAGKPSSLLIDTSHTRVAYLVTEVDTLINASQVVFCLRAAMQNLHMQKLHSLCAFPPLSARLAKNGIRTPWSQHLEKIKLSNSKLARE
ncbi:hypothetical protein SFRURICE_003403 [Spodoptera frugiperda]|nr:hypothetical protein SFRURICE_003403 [Spodoptera frugiperda]